MRDFNHTISVLVNAYINDTLQHQKCSACAVGNMIVASGYKFSANDTDPKGQIQWLGYIKALDGSYPWHSFIDVDEAKRQIESTGYTLEEVRAIESAFENCPFSDTDDVWMFNGLMAVVDVLAEIHGIDLSTREETKKLFVKDTQR